jgi:hypothetical protein
LAERNAAGQGKGCDCRDEKQFAYDDGLLNACVLRQIEENLYTNKLAGELSKDAADASAKPETVWL